MPPRQIANFGGNVRFTPRHLYKPATEAEVLEILNKHAYGKVRVLGALHSWRPSVVDADAMVDMCRFDAVDIERARNGSVWAVVGGGCRIKDLLWKLQQLAGVTLPSIGLMTEQSIAGAISTGTHGSGRHPMSHYMAEIRVAAYDANGKARVYEWKSGVELRAARCAVGCMGIILSVKFRCVLRYEVAESIVSCTTLDEVLAKESEFSLQQFYLLPHRWTYLVQRRAALDWPKRRSLGALIYRAYWHLFIDIGLHVVLRLLVDFVKRPSLVRFFYRHILTKLIPKNRTVIDRDCRMLVMEHELFRHFEIEILVPSRHLQSSAAFVRAIVEAFDRPSAVVSPEIATKLQAIGLDRELQALRGSFTHHYPITFRRVLADDTLISMSCGDAEPYYAISFITYAQQGDAFFGLASFLARSMTKLFAARLHWGKHFPLTREEIAELYPGLAEFRRICRQVDPNGVFRNDFSKRIGLNGD